MLLVVINVGVLLGLLAQRAGNFFMVLADELLEVIDDLVSAWR